MSTVDLSVTGDPADGLAAVVALRKLADRLEAAEVERALRAGWTWARVAEGLGVTRQAVHKKSAKRPRKGGGSLSASSRSRAPLPCGRATRRAWPAHAVLAATEGTVPRALRLAGVDPEELAVEVHAALDARRSAA